MGAATSVTTTLSRTARHVGRAHALRRDGRVPGGHLLTGTLLVTTGGLGAGLVSFTGTQYQFPSSVTGDTADRAAAIRALQARTALAPQVIVAALHHMLSEVRPRSTDKEWLHRVYTRAGVGKERNTAECVCRRTGLCAVCDPSVSVLLLPIGRPVLPCHRAHIHSHRRTIAYVVDLSPVC